MKLEHILFTHQGTRQFNADTLRYAELSDGLSAFLVVDGCKDSDLSVEFANQFGDKFISSLQEVRFQQLQKNASEYLNSLTIKIAKEICVAADNLLLRQQKCTFALAIIHQEFVVTVHVGDCRIYRVRSNEISHTVDHTIKRAFGLDGVPGTILTRVISCKNIPDVEVQVLQPLRTNECMVLCTDGFWRNVSNEKLTALQQLSNSGVATKQIVDKLFMSICEDDNASAQFIWQLK